MLRRRVMKGEERKGEWGKVATDKQNKRIATEKKRRKNVKRVMVMIDEYFMFRR